MSAEARMAAATFWEYLAFVLNSLVFLLIGMAVQVVILSILAQGIAVGPALRWLGLRRDKATHTGYAEIRAELLSTHRALEDLDRTANMVTADDEMRRVLAAAYDKRIERAGGDLTSLGEALGAHDGRRSPPVGWYARRSGNTCSTRFMLVA